MDLLSVVAQNARLDAKARARGRQAKSVNKDATRSRRAKEANLKGYFEVLSPGVRSTPRVRFGAFVEQSKSLVLPAKSILKRFAQRATTPLPAPPLR